MEMLVVVAIISIFVGVIGFGLLRGSANSTAGLSATQSILVALLTQARSQAILTGRNAAVLVNNNPANADRYMRYLVVVVSNESGDLVPIDVGTYLPEGCYIVPNVTPVAVDAGTWTAVRSLALRAASSVPPIESVAIEPWLGLGFTPRGTTWNPSGGPPPGGNIVVSTGRPAAPGAARPFVYTNVNGVRGVAVSVHGLPRLLDDRVDF